jgi:membrane protein YdbS with pleckstrin-like domain
VALGIFAFLLWNELQFPQKHRVLWTLLISVFGDLLWVLVVSVGKWHQEETMNWHLRTLTQVASIANMVYKIGVVGYAVCKYEHSKDLFKLEAFNKKFLYL